MIVTESRMCDVPPAAVIALLYRSYPGLIVFSSDKSTTLGQQCEDKAHAPPVAVLDRTTSTSTRFIAQCTAPLRVRASDR